MQFKCIVRVCNGFVVVDVVVASFAVYQNATSLVSFRSKLKLK